MVDFRLAASTTAEETSVLRPRFERFSSRRGAEGRSVKSTGKVHPGRLARVKIVILLCRRPPARWERLFEEFLLQNSI
jgi:hypothetical protein